MIPIPQDRLPEILKPIYDLRVVESNFVHQAHFLHAMQYLDTGYELRNTAAYVDNLEDAKSCLIMHIGSSWVSPAPRAVCLMLWVHPDVRGHAPELVKDMFATMEAFAKVNECETMVGSSWVYLGAQDTEGLWGRHGFDLQEKVFTKLIE